MATDDTTKQDDDGNRWLRFLIAVVLAVVVVALLLGPAEQLLRGLVEWIEQLGAVGGAVFVVVYVLATVLFLPGLVLTVAAGFLFGLVWGTVAVSLASTLGAAAAFFIGRYLARDAVKKRVESAPRFHALYRAIEREGFRVVLLTRLVPLVPFNLLNYAYGLTDVSWRRYVLASWIGMLPGTVVYVYLGATAGTLARAFTADSPPDAASWGLWGLGLAAVAALVWLVTKRAKAELDDILEEPTDEPSDSPPGFDGSVHGGD